MAENKHSTPSHLLRRHAHVETGAVHVDRIRLVQQLVVALETAARPDGGHHLGREVVGRILSGS